MRVSGQLKKTATIELKSSSVGSEFLGLRTARSEGLVLKDREEVLRMNGEGFKPATKRSMTTEDMILYKTEYQQQDTDV